MIILILPFYAAFCCELGVPAAESTQAPPPNFVAAQEVAAELGDRREERIERREDRQKDRGAKKPDGSTFWERVGSFFGKVERTLFFHLELLELAWRASWIAIAFLLLCAVHVARGFFIAVTKNPE